MQALTTGHHDDESARESQAGFALLAEALERQLLTIKEQAALLEVAQEAILVRELGGTIVFWNRAAEQLYGWGREEAVDNVTHAILATDFPKPFEDILAELRDTGRWEGELVHRRRDGTRIVVASRWVLCRREDEPDPLVLETNTDVTERRQAEAALRESEERFRAVFESAALGIALVGMDGVVADSNRALAELLGFDRPDQLRGRSFIELAHPEDGEDDRVLFDELVEETRRSYQVDKRFVRGDGTIVPARVTVSLVRGAPGMARFAVVMVEDMSLALVDELTGLSNRRAFLAFGQQHLALAVRERRSPAVVFIDVNALKAVNDRYGHPEGDRALADLADILRLTLRASDYCARLGGDEFCILLPDGGHVELAAERIQLEMLEWNGRAERPYSLSVSMGWARFDWRDPHSIEDLIARADKAMYRDKGLSG
jgi:diguanylate cyclase (GGDEF)-like protein/PAS domain S-box-containing protein